MYFPISSSSSWTTAEMRGGIGYGTLDKSYIYGYTVYYTRETTSDVRKLFCGDSQINDIRLGDSQVKSVYVGSNKVFGTKTTTTKEYDYNVYPCYVYYAYGTFYTSAQLSTPAECASQLEISKYDIQYGVQIDFDNYSETTLGDFDINLYINGVRVRKDWNIEGHQSSSGTQYIYNEKVIAIHNTHLSTLTNVTNTNYPGTFPKTIKIPPKTLMFFNMGDLQSGLQITSNADGSTSLYDCKIVITSREGLILTMPLDFSGLTNYYAK